MKLKNINITMFALMTLFCSNAIAGEVSIVGAKANKTSDTTYHFSVTLKHADDGWDHYADQWQILTPEHKVLGTRTLFHPHVNEQPFTRSLGGVAIPTGISNVIIQARDTVHGISPQEFELQLP